MTPLTKLVLRRLFAIIIASILFVGWFWIVGRFARYFGAPFQGSGAAVNSNSTLWSICWETAELGFGIVLSSLALALLWDVRPPRRRLLIPLLIFLALLTTVSALNYADLDHVLGHSTQSGINLICALFGLFVTALLMNWIPLGIFPRILKALALFFLLFGVVLLPLALSLAFWLYRIRVFTTKKQADDFGAAECGFTSGIGSDYSYIGSALFGIDPAAQETISCCSIVSERSSPSRAASLGAFGALSTAPGRSKQNTLQLEGNGLS
jgi:hypothetical protein